MVYPSVASVTPCEGELIFLREERVYLWGHNTDDSRVVSNVNEKKWPGVKKKTKKQIVNKIAPQG